MTDRNSRSQRWTISQKVTEFKFFIANTKVIHQIFLTGGAAEVSAASHLAAELHDNRDIAANL